MSSSKKDAVDSLNTNSTTIRFAAGSSIPANKVFKVEDASAERQARADKPDGFVLISTDVLYRICPKLERSNK